MRLTLRQVFLITSAGLLVLLGVLFYILYDGSRRSILDSAQRLQRGDAQRISEQFVNYLGSAETALGDVADQLRYGNLRLDDPAGLEAALFARVRSNPYLSEATLTYAQGLEFKPNGELLRATGDRWQLSVYRSNDGTGRIVTRRVYLAGGAGGTGGDFRADVRDRAPGEGLADTPLRPSGRAFADPTSHLTFQTLVSKEFQGQRLWSDLHWSELDSSPPAPPDPPTTTPATMPAAAAPATAPALATAAPTTPATGPATAPAPDAALSSRRVEVTVQQAIKSRPDDPKSGQDGKLLGVLRVGLLADQLDRLAQLSLGSDKEDGAHLVFVCDPQGRLVTHCGDGSCLAVMGDDIRFDAPNAAPPIAAAVQLPVVRDLPQGQSADSVVTVKGRRYLVTFRAMEPGVTQEWIIGVLAPEDHYLAVLEPVRRRLLFASLIVIGVILLSGVVTLRLVQKGLARVVAVSRRMRDFDFQPAKTAAPIQDLRDVLESIEQAKTAMRAMGKYVPVGLVRDLYKLNREPELGGDLTDVTLMFTDIMGFTAIAERLSPDELALALGDYFAAMAYAVHANGGIIDKFIGDAVMALWNVPTPLEGHPKHACAAALACLRATRNVADSPRWRGLPPLVTRIGLHRDRVMVGHFGAPDRLSYTVLGDGVNLASRLESLNKQYGTRVLVSEPIRDAAADTFRFRLLDVVVVKGKTRGVRIYELRGPTDEPDPANGVVARYEEALAAYQARDFAVAESILIAQANADAPSRVLAARCRELAEAPPPPEWDGVYVARAK